MAEFKSTISSQNFDKALQGGLDYAADKSGIQEALKELSAKGFVYIGPDQPTDGTMYWLDTSVDEPDVPVVPDEPDVPDNPEVTLTSISATYSGGDVAVGTALTDLTGIVVTATYSDGSTAPVTGYTLSGTIAEGSNTITVTYEGKTATFTVTGVAESGGDEPTSALTGITAVYSGGDVAAKTTLTDLTGLVVSAQYEDGSTRNVTDYTLKAQMSDTVVYEGVNIVTVTYREQTALFAVTGLSDGSGEELMVASNIVATEKNITINATYSFYETKEVEGVNIYEIPVEAGETYAVTYINKSSYDTTCYWDGGTTFTNLSTAALGISATKLTDFVPSGRITHTFDANGTLSEFTKVKNDDGYYVRTKTYVPAISGYLYVDAERTTGSQTWSIKKVVS